MFVRVPEWHPDEVPDYTFRVYAPVKLNITQINYANLTQATTAMAHYEFTSAKAVIPTTVFTTTTGGRLNRTTQWYGSNYFMSFRSNSTT